MDENNLFYSIQQTYIITQEINPEKIIFTCDQRIDIPTIDPLPYMQIAFGSNIMPKMLPVSDESTRTVVPCVELACEFLSEFSLTFETNEGVTVLPVEIPSVGNKNPYLKSRYVLVLPRGSTGVKSCRLIHKDNGEEAQHNFTFGIMPPPYNYDNALFGDISFSIQNIGTQYNEMRKDMASLMLVADTPFFNYIDLPKRAGKQTINIEEGVLFYETEFRYPLSPEPTTHNPKITLHGRSRDLVYTLSLNKTTNTVSIDLLTGMLTVYDGVTGEIIQQFKLALPYSGFQTLSFEDFDDVNTYNLRVTPKGVRVI